MLSHLDTEAHVWLVRPDDIRDSKQLNAYLELLSDDERERYERFHFAVHRKLYLVSHALVRTTLSRYADISASKWKFSTGEFGRPEISMASKAPRLRFNLSHTEGLAACVVCLDLDCGLDVERLHRVRDLDGVARRVFTPHELEDLRGRSGNSLQGRFTDYWTLKEAYMKARGKGFQLPPQTFSIRLTKCGEDRARLEFPTGFDDRADQWQLALYPLSHWEKNPYRLGVALRKDAAGTRRIVIRQTIPG